MNNLSPLEAQRAANQRSEAEEKFASARSNLLLMTVLSTINLFLLAFGSTNMLLFSATIPYWIAARSIVFDVTVLGFVLAMVLLLVYLLCWWKSEEHFGWMVAALVFFIIDTAFMAWLYVKAADVAGIMDVLIHAWVLYYLIIGIVYGRRLRTLPPAEVTPAHDACEATTGNTESYPLPDTNSPVLRRIDEDVKCRVLLDAEALGHHIVYRRVKRVNELVIDYYVYDDVEMLVESAHALNARIDGHAVEVGYDGASHSYLKVDGQTVAKKLRLW
ncbi:MAG: hypothetical protein IJY28_07190 [Clostridia bacterium]|nr:hypothetical protein [Clostridia bacterium]